MNLKLSPLILGITVSVLGHDAWRHLTNHFTAVSPNIPPTWQLRLNRTSMGRVKAMEVTHFNRDPRPENVGEGRHEVKLVDGSGGEPTALAPLSPMISS